MDVRKIDEGATLTLHPVDEKVGDVVLRLMPIKAFGAETPKTDADNSEWVKFLSRFVIGWYLKRADDEIPCDDVNKEKYLGYVLQLPVKKADKEQTTELAFSAIMRFVTDTANFLKN
jgi:hypothetical protein